MASKYQYSLKHIASYQTDYTIYIDGSAAERTSNECTAAFITKGPSTQPTELLASIKIKNRTCTSSCEEEASAMESTLTWISTIANHQSLTILFCTGNKYLCETLMSWNPCTSFILESINSISSSIYIQWIPGHFDIRGS